MRKYGVDNFYFEVIETCNNSMLDERERYWINHYDSYKNGYNETPGGARGSFLSDEEINAVCNLWQKGYSTLDIMPIVHRGNCAIMRCLKQYEPTYNKKEAMKRVGKKNSRKKERPINQYTLDGNLISAYKSSREAEEQTGVSMKAITACCSGQTYSTGGYMWTYQDAPHPGIRAEKDKRHKKHSNECSPVLQYDLDGNFIRKYSSSREAAESNHISKGNLSSCCHGLRLTAGGYKWKFANAG